MQGTPDFVSPEVRSEKELILTLTLLIDNQVINYEPIGPGSDMWSVGVITYVLLSGNLIITNIILVKLDITGLSPFLGNSNIETFSNITGCHYTLEEDQFDVIR